jgi:hypothetical protein
MILMDCMAVMPCVDGSQARALITKAEKAKNTPAISPHPIIEKSVKGKRKLLIIAIKPPTMRSQVFVVIDLQL